MRKTSRPGCFSIPHDGSEAPEIGDFKEKGPFVLVKALILHEAAGDPLLPVIERAVSQMDDRPRDIGEGGQDIGQNFLPVAVVLHNPPEKQISVDLVGQFTVHNRVIINPPGILTAGEIDIGQIQLTVKFIRRKISQNGRESVASSLIGSRGIINRLKQDCSRSIKTSIVDLQRGKRL